MFIRARIYVCMYVCKYAKTLWKRFPLFSIHMSSLCVFMLMTVSCWSEKAHFALTCNKTNYACLSACLCRVGVHLYVFVINLLDLMSKRLCVYMCVYIQNHNLAWVYHCMYVYIYIYIYIRKYIYIYMHVYMSRKTAMFRDLLHQKSRLVYTCPYMHTYAYVP